MATRSPRGGIGAARRRPELPAFCRTRRRHPVVVEISRLRGLQAQLWLVLLFQLSTLLLVLALLPSPAPIGESGSTYGAQQQEQEKQRP